jgi:prepilin-type N-terminal cleavage/methylation domain-containing protein
MNSKGFTVIEVLAAILVIALILVAALAGTGLLHSTPLNEFMNMKLGDMKTLHFAIMMIILLWLFG